MMTIPDPITEKETTQRLLWPAIGYAGGAATVSWWMSELLVPLAVIGLILAIVNAWQLAHRTAYTRAIREMKPLDEHDLEELFPDEIDPEEAEPDANEIVRFFYLQLVLAGLLWLAFFWILKAVPITR